MSDEGNEIQAGPGATPKTYHGGCHCGRVKYQVDLDLSRGVSHCNCSICTKINGMSAMAKPQQFKLLTGEGECSTYAFGPVSTRYFCKHCGIHLFGFGDLPELGGAFVGISTNTLDDLDARMLPTTHWDGRHDNWDAGPRAEPWPVFV